MSISLQSDEWLENSVILFLFLFVVWVVLLGFMWSVWWLLYGGWSVWLYVLCFGIANQCKAHGSAEVNIDKKLAVSVCSKIEGQLSDMKIFWG